MVSCEGNEGVCGRGGERGRGQCAIDKVFGSGEVNR